MLCVEDLHVAYGGVAAVRGLSLQVPTARIVVLLGANGAGKSTTLQAICGLVPVSGGRITFEDRDLGQLRAHQIVRRGLALVPERRELFPELTVAQNLQLGSYTRHDQAAIRHDRQRVLDLFPVLAERTNQLARTLSGGEQQMLAIGRALMSRPRLLLLDEPSLGLAPMLIERIFEAIREINQAGTAILLVEQNTALALDLADYAYVLENGSLVLQGTGAELRGSQLVQQSYLGAPS